MEHNSHSAHGVVVQSTLMTLPIEVLLFICSFLSVRDIVKIRCVSKTLRHVGDTPSLWKTFIWSLYPPRDSELLEHVLKMFGEHVKQFHFADVPPSKLEVMLKFCKNVTHLSLPRFTYYSEFGKLEKIVCSMGSLQILDIQSCTNINIQQLLKLASNLKELSIYRRLHYHGSNNRILSLSLDIPKWIEQWANLNYLPRKLNVVIGLCDPSYFLKNCLTVLKNKKLSKILDLPNIAWFNIYNQKSTDFVSVVPCIQVRVTDSSVTLPSVRGKSLGLDLQWSNWRSLQKYVHLTQGSYHGKKVHKARLDAIDGIDEYIDNSVTNLAFVTYFDASTSLLPEHLEWLSIACPNLQRLDLSGNATCLRDLQGLRSVAKNCRNLQCLNLTGIDGEDIDRQFYGFRLNVGELWRILCIMHLTELSVEGWMLPGGIEGWMLPGGIEGWRLTGGSQNVFQKYLSLRVLEVTCQHTGPGGICPSSSYLGRGSLKLLSRFPSITSCKLGGLLLRNGQGLNQIFSCRYLRSLLLHFMDFLKEVILSLPLECHCTCLQEVYIYGEKIILAETFINALCAHSGLEHVVFHVKSLTARSVTTLIEHSPNLVTFEITLCPESWMEAQLKHLNAYVRTRFYKTKLIDGGFFSMELYYHSVEYLWYNQYAFGECHLDFHNKDPWILTSHAV